MGGGWGKRAAGHFHVHSWSGSGTKIASIPLPYKPASMNIEPVQAHQMNLFIGIIGNLGHD